MKNSKWFLALVAAATMGFSSASFADDMDGHDEVDGGGLFVEPAITYQWGDTNVSYPAPFSDSTESIKGYGLGLRLGGHVYDTVFLALDGRYARPRYDSSALGGEADASAYNAGLTLGAQTPLLGIRVWGTYIFTGELDPDEINGADVKFEDFRGYRVGAGIRFAFVSVNLEYQDGKYDKATLQNGGIFGGTSDDVDGRDKSYILSLSFPLSL